MIRRCRLCPFTKLGGPPLQDGLCQGCVERVRRMAEEELAGIAVATYDRELGEWLEKRVRFDAFLRRRGEAEEPAKTWRWDDLPPWRKLEPMRYDDD